MVVPKRCCCDVPERFKRAGRYGDLDGWMGELGGGEGIGVIGQDGCEDCGWYSYVRREGADLDNSKHQALRRGLENSRSEK